MSMDRVDEVLASLREERERLTAELQRVERAIAALDGQSIQAIAARPYAMLNVYEAAAHFLAQAGEPKTTREIANALRAGGFRTRSERFTATVGTMLSRQKSASYFGIRRTSDKKRWVVRASRNATDGGEVSTSGIA
jgi:hypothetical protein